MTYGAEAVIPLETEFPTLRTSLFTLDNLLEKSLNLVEEWRENIMVQLAYYQQKLKQGYDSDVKLRPLNPGDLVLRKVVGTSKNPIWGKLWPNWEGLYRITSIASVGAYFLEDLDEKVVLRPWNVITCESTTINERQLCHVFIYDIMCCVYCLFEYSTEPQLYLTLRITYLG